MVFKAKTGPLHLTPSYQPWSGNPEVSLGPTRLTLPALFYLLPGAAYNPRAPLGPHGFRDPIPQPFPVDKTLLLELWVLFSRCLTSRKSLVPGAKFPLSRLNPDPS